MVPSLRRCRELFIRHLHFVGPGLVSAVAYIDPGNWATDLEAGAEYGYKLLFIVLLAGLAAVVLQTLTVRLGATTSTSLPFQTRRLFLRLEAKYPKYRVPLHCGLWALYILAEVAIIATDLAELLGSAIALHMLFPRLPLYAGVLITAADVLIVLAFFNSNGGRQGMMFFEILIVTLVLAVFVSFMILLKLVKPDWGEVFLGYLPSKTLVKPGALYIGVGIIGATVMPHALFLGSSLSSVDRLNMLPLPPTLERAKRSHRLPSLFKCRRNRQQTQQQAEAEDQQEYELQEVVPIPSDSAPTPGPSIPGRGLESQMGIGRRQSRTADMMDRERDRDRDSDGYMYKERDLVSGMGVEIPMDTGSKDEHDLAVERYERDIKSFDRIEWVDIHLKHATIDTTYSLLGFALTINSSILILAGAAFYYNPTANKDADLQGAHDLIKDYLGNAPAIIFALALLCAGQSASITATLAGQVVSEGFINWRTPPTIRRLVTRLIGVIPAGIVAAAVGNKGLNTMLVASQVLLSIVLPTVIFPLVYLCSREDIMTVDGPEIDTVVRPVQVDPPAAGGRDEDVAATGGMGTSMEGTPTTEMQEHAGERRKKSFKSPTWVTVLGYALFVIVIIANCYVIVELGLGHGG